MLNNATMLAIAQFDEVERTKAALQRVEDTLLAQKVKLIQLIKDIPNEDIIEYVNITEQSDKS